MNKKTKKNIKKAFKNLHKDISYKQGGWLWFCVRMMTNVIILYYVMGFFEALFKWVFMQYHIELNSEHMNIVGVLVWFTGIIYMITRKET